MYNHSVRKSQAMNLVLFLWREKEELVCLCPRRSRTKAERPALVGWACLSPPVTGGSAGHSGGVKTPEDVSRHFSDSEDQPTTVPVGSLLPAWRTSSGLPLNEHCIHRSPAPADPRGSLPAGVGAPVRPGGHAQLPGQSSCHLLSTQPLSASS